MMTSYAAPTTRQGSTARCRSRAAGSTIPGRLQRQALSALLLDFVPSDDLLSEYHRITHKPILFSTIGARADEADHTYDADEPNEWHPKWLLEAHDTQAQRADDIRDTVRAIYGRKYAIGYTVFCRMDQPWSGWAGDGQDSNSRLVTLYDDKPYDAFVEALTEATAEARASRRRIDALPRPAKDGLRSGR